jgi:hypothetical protein
LANIAFLHGNGYIADDVLYKLPVIRHLEGHDVYVASRIRSDVHLGPELQRLVGDRLYEDIRKGTGELSRSAKKYEFVYDSPHLGMQYAPEEIAEVERWLGMPLRYLASFDKDFYDRERRRDLRDPAELTSLAAGLTLFFRDFFKANCIRAFFTNMEDDVFSISALYVARRLGIRVIGYTYSKFPKKGVWLRDDIRDVFAWDDRLADWGEIEPQYTEDTIAGRWVMERNAAYYSLASLRQRLRGLGFNRGYRRYIDHVIRQYPYERNIIECTSLYREARKFVTSFVRRRLVRGIVSEPDYGEKYVLFALHYMNDAQVSYREPMLDQFELIRNIARALPASCRLYVKPHPHFFGSDVSFRDLNGLRQFDNVRIVNPAAPPQKLIRNAQCVVTVNSATGFEAIIMGVPVVSLGHDFYCRDDLCTLVRDLNDLPAALLKAMGGQDGRDRGHAKDFVRSLYAHTIWVKGVQYSFGYYGLSEDEGKAVAQAMNAILDKYCGKP